MTKKILMVVGGLLAVLIVVGAVGATVAYAQGQSSNAFGWLGNGHGPGNGKGFNLSGAALDAAAKALNMTSDDLSAQLKSGKTLQEIATAQGVDIKTVMQAIRAVQPVRSVMLGSAELDAAAKALGMTSEDLSAQLKSGKSLSDVATEKGVDLQIVQDAIKAARTTEIRDQINQAVTDGKITQDKADWLLEGLDKGYLDGPGFGFGFGFDFGQRGPRPNGVATPSAQQ